MREICMRTDEGNRVGLSGVTRQSSANQQGELSIEFKEEEGKCQKCLRK